MDYLSMGRFDKFNVAEGTAFIGIGTTKFNGYGDINFASPQISGLILSTDENEGCYSVGDFLPD